MTKLLLKVDIKKIAISLLSVSVIGCGEDKGNSTVRERQPVTDCIVKITPVKNQGHSSFCWIYAMLATIESNHIMRGDSVNLSTDYVARKLLEEQAVKCYLSAGCTRLTTRGVAPELIRLIRQYGLTHYDAYHTEANMNVITRRLERATSRAIAKQCRLDALRRIISEILDDGMRPLNKDVYMLGAKYSPLEFAHSVCRENEYIAMTSFTHHPFGQEFALEVPDNHNNSTFLNVPIDSLQAYTERSLQDGYAVCWEGDISEPGFSFAEGFAVLENNNIKVTQEARQRDFERFKTTDDHCMEIIGIAHDKHNRKYFICKNSWGKNNPFGGLMYMSEAYFRSKTIAIIKAKG